MSDTSKRWIKRIVTFAVSMLMLITSVFSPAVALSKKPVVLAAGATYEDIKDAKTEAMREQLAELEKKKKEVQAELKESLKKQSSYEEKKELYLTLSALYDDQLNTLEIELLTFDEQIEDIGKEIVDTQFEYDETYKDFLSLMRMTYEDGNVNFMDLILGATSLSDLFSRVENMNALLGYNDRLMAKLEESKKTLEENRVLLEEKKEEQKDAIAALEVKKQEVAEWTAENEEALAQIEKEIEKKRAAVGDEADKYDVLKAEFDAEVKRQIDAENARRKAEAEKKRQQELEEKARRQSYMWPLPTKYTALTSTFNEVRTINSLGYVNKVHYGIDIPAPSGTSIYASKAGKVITATYHYSYGNYVLIDHGDGTQTLYAHCSKLLVSAGTYVEQGKEIAKVGTTGSSTGNHLHFEFRTGGRAVNPLKYVKKP
ncbi:MAG: peptidoglycan DD-metalloendopeptidase family protein [Clostridia bacterium]|nr:peptidoglycan DD-metalloendopeptidase family protein [Clostridia bacterium]